MTVYGNFKRFVLRMNNTDEVFIKILKLLYKLNVVAGTEYFFSLNRIHVYGNPHKNNDLVSHAALVGRSVK